MNMKTAAIIAGAIVLIFIGAALTTGKPAYFDDNSPVMYFYSETCHFCIQEKPILAELAKEGFRLKPINIATQQAVFQKYGVLGTPAFISSKNSTARLDGFQEKEPLRIFLLANGAKIA